MKLWKLSFCVLSNIFLFIQSSYALDTNVAIHILTPDKMKWMDIPEIPGIKLVSLMGDPKKSGPFIIRIKLPAGYTVKPHVHPVDEYNTVISGSYHLGFGKVLDKNNTVKITPGTFVTIPAGTPHYGYSDEEAILQADARGPWNMIPIKE